MEKIEKEDLPTLLFGLFIFLTVIPFLDLLVVPFLLIIRKNFKVGLIIWFKVVVYALTGLWLLYQYKLGVFPR